jgi:hypothetical protein
MLNPLDSVMTVSVEKMLLEREELDTGKNPANEADFTAVSCSISFFRDCLVSRGNPELLTTNTSSLLKPKFAD